jgi:hypothetical protein
VNVDPGYILRLGRVRAGAWAAFDGSMEGNQLALAVLDDLVEAGNTDRSQCPSRWSANPRKVRVVHRINSGPDRWVVVGLALCCGEIPNHLHV